MGKMRACACAVALLVLLGGCAAQENTESSRDAATAPSQSSAEIAEPSVSEGKETEESGVSEPEGTDEPDSGETEGKVEVSLEEAVAMGQKEADKYYDNLRLTEIHSYDNDADRSVSAGENGAREWWYVNFANEQLNYVSIMISDGELTVNAFDENANNGLFDLSEVQLTAKEAVEKAKQLGLRGGDPENEEEWVSGYNFKLSYGSLVEAPDDVRLFFEVIGISPDGNFAQVDFDGVTGELLLAEEQVEDENGNLVWKTFA